MLTLFLVEHCYLESQSRIVKHVKEERKRKERKGLSSDTDRPPTGKETEAAAD